MAGGRKKRTTDATPTRVSARQQGKRPNLQSIAETDADDGTTAGAASAAAAAAATAATTTAEADGTIRKTDGTTATTTTNLHPLSPPALKSKYSSEALQLQLASKYKNSPSSEAYDIATGFRLYTKIISQTTNTTTTTSSNSNSTTTMDPTDDGGGKNSGGNNVNCEDVGRDRSGGSNNEDGDETDDEDEEESDDEFFSSAAFLNTVEYLNEGVQPMPLRGTEQA